MNFQPFSLLLQYGRLCRIAATAKENPTKAMALALALPDVPGSSRMRRSVARKVVRCHRERLEVRG